MSMKRRQEAETRHPTQQELFDLGLQDTAYIKAALAEGQRIWAIFQADGVQIGWAPTRDLAFAAVRQHDMEPVSVH